MQLPLAPSRAPPTQLDLSQHFLVAFTQLCKFMLRISLYDQQ